MSRRARLPLLAPLALVAACASSAAPPPPLPPPPTPLPALPDDAPLARAQPNPIPSDTPPHLAPPVATGGRELAALNLGFQGCRVMGLRLDPSMRGSALLTARLAASGQVLDVEATRIESLPRTVVTCLLARVQHARFDPRGGDGSLLVIPVDFTSVGESSSARPAPAPTGVHNL